MIPTAELTHPAVRAFVEALNAGDREAFTAALTPGAGMSDDGTERDLTTWAEKQIFGSNAHLDVETEGDSGRAFVARYRNDTGGEMRTTWRFTVKDGKISRFVTGQA